MGEKAGCKEILEGMKKRRRKQEEGNRGEKEVEEKVRGKREER